MVAYNSAQMAVLAEHPPGRLTARDAHGTVRMAWFSYTTPAGGCAVDDTIALCRVPRGARLLGGHYTAEAMSSGAGDAAVKFGDGTTADKYLGSTTVDAAAAGSFNDTVARALGSTLSADLVLTATVTGEAWAAGKLLSGYLQYVTD